MLRKNGTTRRVVVYFLVLTLLFGNGIFQVAMAETLGDSEQELTESPLTEERTSGSVIVIEPDEEEGSPPADEESPPADEESPPADEESPPADEESPPADEESPPADEESPPADEETPPADEETPPADEETPPADEETPPAEEGTPPEEQGTPPEEQGTPPEEEGTPPEEQGTPPEEEGTPPEEQGTPPEEGAIPPENPLPEEPPVQEEAALPEAPEPTDEFLGDNPDGLDGPEPIKAPKLYVPSAKRMQLVPFGAPTTMDMRSMSVVENGGDFNNIEPPAPGSLSLNKTAELLTGYSDRWTIELELTGKNLPTPSDIVLVIDRSGSMSGTKLSAAKDAAKDFVNTLFVDENNTTTQIALISFAGDVETERLFTGAAGKQDLLDDIDALSAGGGTFTQAALRQAHLLLDTSTADSKNIVLLSDGEPTYSYELTSSGISDLSNFEELNQYYYFPYYGSYWIDFVNKDSIAESDYDYDETAGNGSSRYSYIREYDDETYYYSHGNSAISESRFAKDKDQTIYTIAFETDSYGDSVLDGIASPGKDYTSSSGDLNQVFQDIAGSIAFAATDATITDPLGPMFNIPGINETNYLDHLTVNRGTLSWDNDNETITWELDTISEGNPATLTYVVEIEPTAVSGVVYPTNEHTYVDYTNALDQSARKSFPIPEVGINAGTIVIHTYRVNTSGEPINSSGVVVAGPEDAELMSETYLSGTPLDLNTPYTITADSEKTIGPDLFRYEPLSSDEGGDTSPTTVTLTPSVPSAHVWFGYQKVDFVTVTFDENYTGAPPTYDVNTEEGTSLGSDMPEDPDRTGYTFEGWFPSSDGTGTEFTSSTTVNENITVYAKWTLTPYTLTIAYDYAGGGQAAPDHTETLNMGDPYDVDSPAIPGYTPDQSNVSGTMPADDVNVTVIYSPNEDTAYKVEHYKEQPSGLYALADTDNLTGTTGTTATAVAKTYTGYSENTTHADRVPSGTIAGDGSLVLKLYYDLNDYTLSITYDYVGGGEAAPDFSTILQMGDGYTVNSPVIPGFTPDRPTVAGTMPADDVTEAVLYSPNEDTAYKVEHYKEQLGGGYSLAETENLTGTTGTTATAVVKSYTGYSENTTHADRVPSGTIAGDGSLVLKLYYDLNDYTLTVRYRYDSVSGPEAAPDHTETLRMDDGYNVSSPSIVGYTPSASVIQGTMGAEDRTYTVVYLPNEDTAYTVNHYKQNVTGSGYTLADTNYQTGTTGETVSAVPMPYTGFVENTTHPDRVPSGTVAADGSLVLSLYYDRIEYTVTFIDDDEDDTVLKVETVRYGGDATPPVNPNHPGYTFDGWIGNYTNVTQDEIVVASYVPLEGTPYKVQHYQEQLDGETYSLVEEEQLGGVTDSLVTATAKSYTGFVENTTHPDRVPSGTVAADGSLVLKLYYDRIEHTVTFIDDDESVLKVETVLHGGDATPPADPEKEGHVFVGWDGTYTNVQQDEIVEAVYRPSNETLYTVEHYLQNLDLEGYSLEDSQALYGTTGALVEAVANSYTGFSENTSHPDRLASANILADGSLVLKLFYDRDTYTVTFDSQGGTPVDPIDGIPHGGTIDLPENPTRPDYIFNGWNLEPDGSGEVFNGETVITGDLTVYAQWTPEPIEEILGELTLTKVVVNTAGSVLSNNTRSFTIRVEGPDGYLNNVTITGNGSQTLSNLQPGTYTISENAPTNYTLLSISPNTVTFDNEVVEVAVTITNRYRPPADDDDDDDDDDDGGGGGTIFIDLTEPDEDVTIDEPVPEAAPAVVPEEEEIILDEPIPEAPATLPQTGETAPWLFTGFGSLLAALGITLGKKKQ